ncbi:MAG TPA: lytic murein transglycosylase [Terriglobales bacterium]|nr:lytic murein transglycosylase [Terriglobales bacterium]
MIRRCCLLSLGLVLLAGCAEPAQPTAPATSTSAGNQAQQGQAQTQATSQLGQPVGVTDFRDLNQTTCPAGAASYRDWVTQFQSYALHQGKRADMIQVAFADVRENPSISAAAGKQPEFVTPVWTYLSRAASPTRIAKGKQKYSENATILTGVSKDYGVPNSVLMGIWGLETDFGSNFGDVNVFEALSNLGYRANRAPFACKELLAALDIADAGRIKPQQMIGSWAGAMGHSQFLPSNYLNVAVDRDGSGAPDLWTSMPDVFASTANLLRHEGWQPGLPWGFEVKLPAKFPYGEAEIDIKQPISHWRALGVKRIDGTALPNLDGDTSILLLAGYKGPAFLITPNFRAILAYNNSTSYALGVAYLGDQILGGKGVQAAWPVNEPQLNLAERTEVQQLLAGRGYDVGEPDGILGFKTRKAARAFQKEIGWPQDGFVTEALLAELRKRSGVKVSSAG